MALDIAIDRAACMGSGTCAYYAPGVFDLDDEGIAVVVDANAQTEDKITREAAMAVGETSGAATPGARRVVSSKGPRKQGGEEEAEATPLLKEADPELEKLLDEEEEIARRTHEGHEAPHFRGDD